MQLRSYLQGYSITIFGDLLARQLKLSLLFVNTTATAPTLQVHHQDINTVQTLS